jgi:hypothetical protein
MRVLATGCAAALAVLSAAAMAVAALSAAVVGAGEAAATAAGSGPPTVPAPMVALYRRAAATCPGLSWSVLAAIGTVESSNGSSTAPGVRSGANGAGAEGPMQFLPATFDEYALPVPPGGAQPPSPYDPTDAVYAAARLLCANGGGAPGGSGLAGAVYAYNHSRAYVAEVLTLAAGDAGRPDYRPPGRPENGVVPGTSFTVPSPP